MNKYTNSLISFLYRPFSRPLQLSGGVITEITEATATVQWAGEKGRGAIYLSDLWAWPDAALSHAERDGRMRRFCERIAASAGTAEDLRAGHPLTAGLRLTARWGGVACAENPEAVPQLARLVCLSAFDAAVHDAAGRARGCSAFALYGEAAGDPELDALAGPGLLADIRRFLLPVPTAAVTGWYVVSGTDPLGDDFREFVSARGFHAFKLKTHGKDPEADARRTVEVYEAARALGVARPRLSADSNEGNPDAESVLAFLTTLERMNADAYAALEYLEQPTGRDIRRHAFDWRAVSARKPVLVDEGLTGLDVLPDVIAQGWSGICLKTCKGHSLNLAAGARAHAAGLRVAVQDLTNPGMAAVQSCLLAMHTPSINGVELNSPQFTPAANAGWDTALPGLFRPVDGLHRLPDPWVAGLGAAPAGS